MGGLSLRTGVEGGGGGRGEEGKGRKGGGSRRCEFASVSSLSILQSWEGRGRGGGIRTTMLGTAILGGMREETIVVVGVERKRRQLSSPLSVLLKSASKSDFARSGGTEREQHAQVGSALKRP